MGGLFVKLAKIHRQADGQIVATYSVFDDDVPEKRLASFNISGRGVDDLAEALTAKLADFRPIDLKRRELVAIGEDAIKKAVG